MKKYIFVILIILLFAVSIASIVYNNNKTDNESIYVKCGNNITKSGATFIFDNQSDVDLDLDDFFKIVKIEEDAVIDLNYERPNLAGFGTSFFKKSISEKKIIWNYYYGELEPGRYIITFYFNDKQYNASAEFFIK